MHDSKFSQSHVKANSVRGTLGKNRTSMVFRRVYSIYADVPPKGIFFSFLFNVFFFFWGGGGGEGEGEGENRS
jgi:hypothetical protein